MFGGIAFLLNAAMCVGVDGKDLIVRCQKEETDQLLTKAGVRIFDLSGGRPMKGWLLVGPEATKTPRGFKGWIDFALAWTASADKKPKRGKKRPAVAASKAARKR
jgi:hypothetical protein